MGGVTDIINAPAKHRIAKAEYAANVRRTANTNKRESTQANFSNFMRSLSNKAQLQAASKEYNFQVGELASSIRQATGGNFNSQLQLESARGALTAQSGFVGVGGTSVDLMDTMVRLQEEMDVEVKDNATRLMAERGQEKAAQIMSNAIGQMDMTQTFGNYDYRQYIEPVAMKKRLGKLIGVAVATYFGGPAMGQAAADAHVGMWKQANQDYNGASQSFNSAVVGFGRGMKGLSDRGGQAWGAAVKEGWSNRSTATVMDTNNYSTSTSGLGWDFNDNPVRGTSLAY